MYKLLCRFIYIRQGLDFDKDRHNKIRKAHQKNTRWLCLYFGKKYIPGLTWQEAAEVFGQDHATAIHAVKTFRNDYDTNKQFRQMVDEIDGEVVMFLRQAGSEEILQVLRVEVVKKQFFDNIEKIERIVEVYCELTGRKII